MNIAALIGFFLAAGIVWFGAVQPTARPGIFLDIHAILLVLGGTIAAALIAFPISRLVRILDFFIMGILFKQPARESDVAVMVVEIAMYYRGGGALADIEIPANAHPFFSEAKQLLQRGIVGDDLKAVLSDRIAYFRATYQADAKMLNALAKFPPAFGLLGASAGMIAMMTNLGQNSADRIGPAMAIALVATFWGIGLANFVILPLADHAARSVSEDTRKRKLIADGIHLLATKIETRTLVERLAGQMSLEERARFFEAVRKRYVIPPNREQQPPTGSSVA